MLIDSGAHSSVAKEGRLIPLTYKGQPKIIVGFGGTQHASRGEAMIEFDIGDHKFSWPMQVFESLGRSKIDTILGRDFVKNRVIMDWINGKIIFVTARKRIIKDDRDQHIYAFCGEEKLKEVQEINDESLSVTVKAPWVEIMANNHKKFPICDLHGLPKNNELKSVLHSVMSIPQFINFINENLSKRAGMIQLLGQAYGETRLSTNHDNRKMIVNWPIN